MLTDFRDLELITTPLYCRRELTKYLLLINYEIIKDTC